MSLSQIWTLQWIPGQLKQACLKSGDETERGRGGGRGGILFSGVSYVKQMKNSCYSSDTGCSTDSSFDYWRIVQVSSAQC